MLFMSILLWLLKFKFVFGNSVIAWDGVNC